MAAVFQEFRKGTTGALDKARLIFNRNSDDEEQQQQQDQQQQQTRGVEQTSSGGSGSSGELLEELSEYCPKLSFQERMIGFAASFSLGYLIAFFSFRFFIELIAGNPLPFAINYTTGHVLQLLASTFLCGPKRQFKNMFDDTRRTTSIVYLSCLLFTFVLIFIPMPWLLKLVLLILSTFSQFCASVWYTLSYIPYGRRTASRMLKRALGLNGSGETPDYSGVIMTASSTSR